MWRRWILILVTVTLVHYLPGIACLAQDDDAVEFRELVLDEPATSMAMTEDGKWVVLTHQSANYVTIYEVLARRIATTTPLLSPRSVICRGDEVFVSNFGEGTVSILSQKQGWKKVNDLKLPGPKVIHLAAPRGKAFARQLIAVCRADSGSHDNKIYLVDIDRDHARELGKSELAEFSADGRTLLIECVIRGDGLGGLAAYGTGQLTNPQGLGDPIYRGGSGQTPYVYQVRTAPYWISQSNIYGGTPLESVLHEPSSLIIPDWSSNRFYVLSDSLIKCRELNQGFPEIDSRQPIYPPAFKDFSKIQQHFERHSALMCDQPCAYVHQNRLHLFVLSPKGAAVLTAETAIFGPTTTP